MAGKGPVQRKVELVALAAGLTALALLGWRFGLSELSAALERVAPTYLVLYLFFGSTARLGYALRWRLVARAVAAPLPLSRFIAARLAGDATGFLLPTGRISGDPLRVGLLYADGVGGSEASAGVAVDRIIEVISNMLCAVAYVTVFSLARAGGAGRAPMILVVTLCLLLAALAVPLEMMRRGKRPLEPLCRVMEQRGSPRWAAWAGALQRTEAHMLRFFRGHPAVFLQGLASSLVIEGLIIAEYHFLLVAFGLTVDLPTLLMTMVASGVARAVPTPAGLGALEAAEVSVLAAATGQPGVGFVVGVVLRLHETLWTGVGLLALAQRGVDWPRLRSVLSATGLTS
jgi:uncharacterized protein (TIRG00374 family)